MDSSFRDQGSDTQQDSKRFLVLLSRIDSSINWLAGLVRLTEESNRRQVFIPVAGGTNKGRPNVFAIQ